MSSDQLARIPPEALAAALAVAVALVRVIRDKEEAKPIRVGLEAVLCGYTRLMKLWLSLRVSRQQ